MNNNKQLTLTGVLALLVAYCLLRFGLVMTAGFGAFGLPLVVFAGAGVVLLYALLDRQYSGRLLQLALEMDESCVLHLYCQSDCDNIIDGYVRRSGGKIVRHTPVSTEEIRRIYTQADVLGNVGNNTPEFKPSKTFEYIATGKPILNIYYEGRVDDALDSAPLSLQLSRSISVVENEVILREFLDANRGKTLPREEIDRLFPKHRRENIQKILKNCVQRE